MKTLPYEGASSGQRALHQIQTVLQEFGCERFGSMQDFNREVLIVQFVYRGREVIVEASMKGYAQQWLKRHPWSSRMRVSQIEHNRKAIGVASLAVYSILRDWIKGQVTAIECGIITFEGAFCGQILLGNGTTVLEYASSKNLLPAAGDEKKARPR